MKSQLNVNNNCMSITYIILYYSTVMYVYTVYTCVSRAKSANI